MRFLSMSAVKTGLLLLVMVVPAWGAEAREPSVIKVDKGDLTVMYQAGVQLLNTGVSETDAAKAQSYLAAVAADSKSEFRSKAKTWLGRAYRDELAGIAKDLKKSFSYFEQAAGKNGKDPEAQYELGKAYLNGAGTDRNLIAAYMWTALSLRKTSPVSDQAEQQKRQLTGMLNDLQLKKARLLVIQLETLYLN